MKKSYIVWAVVNNKEEVLTDMTSFYFKRDFARQSVYLLNSDNSMKAKPYKVKKAYLRFKR